MDLIWKGQYSYNEIFDENENYDFELKVQLNKGSFIGTAIEQEFTKLTGGDSPSVKGFFEDDHISFVKKYPYKFESDSQGSTIIDKNQKGHEVVYDGYFNTELGIWEGTWEIATKEERVVKDLYKTYFALGSWRMKREIDT